VLTEAFTLQKVKRLLNKAKEGSTDLFYRLFEYALQKK
jgi:hypothetical protein